MTARPAIAPLRVILADTAAPDLPGSMRGYADQIQAGLARRHMDWTIVRWHLAAPAAALRWLPPRLRPWAQHAVIWHRSRHLAAAGASLVHVLDGSHAYLARRLPPTQPWLATVHDLIPVLQMQGRFPPRPSLPARRLIRASLRQLRRAPLCLADSAHTAADLVRLTGRDPATVCRQPLGLSPVIETDPPRADAVPGLPARYLLHVGNAAFYKNRATVLRVAARLASTDPLPLVMAGAPLAAHELALAAQLGLQDRLHVYPHVEPARLRHLYRHAALLLFPSRYEGFGLPPLEAMALGCPVVCSTAASLPEVVGPAALTAGPDDVDKLAQLCRRILTEPELTARLRAAGRVRAAAFTVDATLTAVEAAYRQLLG